MVSAQMEIIVGFIQLLLRPHLHIGVQVDLEGLTSAWDSWQGGELCVCACVCKGSTLKDSSDTPFPGPPQRMQPSRAWLIWALIWERKNCQLCASKDLPVAWRELFLLLLFLLWFVLTRCPSEKEDGGGNIHKTARLILAM